MEGGRKAASSCSEQPGDAAYDGIRGHLGKEMEHDQTQLTSWVTAEPKSVLESSHVIYSVNHGGASSFNEALW